MRAHFPSVARFILAVAAAAALVLATPAPCRGLASMPAETPTIPPTPPTARPTPRSTATPWPQVWLPLVARMQAGPVPGQGFYDVSAVPGAPADGWIAPGVGMLRWDGVRWTRQPVTMPWNHFAVSMVSATDGWLIAHWPTIASGTWNFAHWDGEKWTYGGVPAGCGYSFWTDVEMVSTTSGWIVGAVCRVLHWDGSAWAVVDKGTDNGWYRAVSAVPGTGGAEAWAAGEGGLIGHGTAAGWAQVTSPVTTTLRGIALMSATDGWAVGDDGVILRYDGAGWQREPSPVTTQLNAVVALPCGAPCAVWAAGEHGVLLRWNGYGWWVVRSPVAFDLYALSFSAADNGWAVGEQGIALHYDGIAWQVAPVAW